MEDDFIAATAAAVGASSHADAALLPPAVTPLQHARMLAASAAAAHQYEAAAWYARKVVTLSRGADSAPADVLQLVKMYLHGGQPRRALQALESFGVMPTPVHSASALPKAAVVAAAAREWLTSGASSQNVATFCAFMLPVDKLEFLYFAGLCLKQLGQWDKCLNLLETCMEGQQAAALQLPKHMDLPASSRALLMLGQADGEHNVSTPTSTDVPQHLRRSQGVAFPWEDVGAGSDHSTWYSLYCMARVAEATAASRNKGGGHVSGLPRTHITPGHEFNIVALLCQLRAEALLHCDNRKRAAQWALAALRLDVYAVSALQLLVDHALLTEAEEAALSVMLDIMTETNLTCAVPVDALVAGTSAIVCMLTSGRKSNVGGGGAAVHSKGRRSPVESSQDDGVPGTVAAPGQGVHNDATHGARDAAAPATAPAATEASSSSAATAAAAAAAAAASTGTGAGAGPAPTPTNTAGAPHSLATASQRSRHTAALAASVAGSPGAISGGGTRRTVPYGTTPPPNAVASPPAPRVLRSSSFRAVRNTTPLLSSPPPAAPAFTTPTSAAASARGGAATAAQRASVPAAHAVQPPAAPAQRAVNSSAPNANSTAPSSPHSGEGSQVRCMFTARWLFDLYDMRLCRFSLKRDLTSVFLRLGVKWQLGIDYDVLSAKADSLAAQHDPSASHVVTRQLAAVDPFCQRLMAVHMANLVQLGRAAPVFKLAHEAAKLFPRDAFSWWMVGCYYLASGNAADALKQFQKATQLDALCAAAWMGVGQAYCLLHEYEPSLAAYRSAMMLLPESHLPPLCMAAVASQSNQNELARTYLDLATSRCISDPMVHHEAGVLEYRRRAYKQAWASLDFAITLIIDAPLAAKRHWEATMFNMACTCRKLGMYSDAVKWYEECLALAPDNASTLAALAFTHLLAGSYDDAVASYHAALALKSDDFMSKRMLEIALMEMLADTTVDDLANLALAPPATSPSNDFADIFGAYAGGGASETPATAGAPATAAATAGGDGGGRARGGGAGRA